MVPLSYFGSPLANWTAVLVTKIRFLIASESVGAFSYFQIVFGDAFGWYLEAFLVVSSCRFSFL